MGDFKKAEEYEHDKVDIAIESDTPELVDPQTFEVDVAALPDTDFSTPRSIESFDLPQAGDPLSIDYSATGSDVGGYYDGQSGLGGYLAPGSVAAPGLRLLGAGTASGPALLVGGAYAGAPLIGAGRAFVQHPAGRRFLWEMTGQVLGEYLGAASGTGLPKPDTTLPPTRPPIVRKF